LSVTDRGPGARRPPGGRSRAFGQTISLVDNMKIIPYTGDIDSLLLIENGRVDPSSMATHEFSFEQIEAAFELMTTKADGIIKPLMRFSTN
jgi:threonine dehydrogenase-like Zn-dependent dehydrogenase